MNLYVLLSRMCTGFMRGIAYVLHLAIFNYVFGWPGFVMSLVAMAICEKAYDSAEMGVNGHQNVRNYGMYNLMMWLSAFVAASGFGLSITLVSTGIYGLVLFGCNTMQDHSYRKLTESVLVEAV